MRIVAIKTLRRCWERHPEAEQPLKAWADEVQQARWSQPAEIKAQFGSASNLKGRRVVFNIKGNEFRLVAALAYRYQALYIKFVGTHAEYDAIDANHVETPP